MNAVSTLTGKDEAHAQELVGLKTICEGVMSAVEVMAADVRALSALITAQVRTWKHAQLLDTCRYMYMYSNDSM